MPLQTHLNRRGAVYQLRVRLPQDIAGKTGCRDIRISLKTRNPDMARRLARVGRAAMARLFDHLRRALMSDEIIPTRYLTNKEIRDLAREFFRQEISTDEIHRVNGEDLGLNFDDRRKKRAAEEQELRQALGSGKLELAHADADRVLAYAGIQPTFDGTEVDIPPNMINQLCYFLLRARLAANRLAQAHDQGEFGAKPTDHLFEDIPSADLNLSDNSILATLAAVSSGTVKAKRLTERQSMPLTEVLELVLKEKKDIKKKTKGDYRNAVTWLAQVVGDKPIGSVTKDDLLKFKETLLDTPTNFKQKLKTGNILEAIKRNQQRKLPNMDRVTVNNKYLGAIRGVFEWASENNYTVNENNPAQDLKVKLTKGKSRSNERLPFSESQLKRLFNTPLYLGCASETRLFTPGKTQVRNFRFWVPLISLFSGCRLNELGQMEIADVTNRYGIPHFVIRTTRDPEEAGDALDTGNAPTRSLKTKAARRFVPVHEELVKIGFLNYLQDCRAKALNGKMKARNQRLFPEWNLGKDGYYSSTFSKWFNAQFLIKSKLKSKELVFHSLRHNFKDAMREGSVSAEAQHRIMGHKSGHVGDGYGKRDIVRAQSKEMRKVRYEELDLSHLHINNPITSLDINAMEVT